MAIVVIGGGTGSYTALRGLKHLTSRISAVVTMADSGGSSGRLRDQLGQLPPGDIRQCLMALSRDETTANSLRRLFNYRFNKGDLSGHSFGNLLLSALMDLTGDVNSAVRQAGQMLGIQGEVLPVSLSDSHLYARLADGTIIAREHNIDVRTEKLGVPIDEVYLDPPATANQQAVDAISAADAIVIGPGDLYTSIIPNLLVGGIPEAIEASPARKIFVCNLMTKRGETDGFTASRFVRELQRYCCPGTKLDCAIVNTGKICGETLAAYRAEGAYPVVPDLEVFPRLVETVLPLPLATPGCLLRHDSHKLAQAVMDYLEAYAPPGRDGVAPADQCHQRNGIAGERSGLDGLALRVDP